MELHLITTETARRPEQVYRDNRAAAYYPDTVAAVRQAEAMFDIAVILHGHIADFARLSYECRYLD